MSAELDDFQLSGNSPKNRPKSRSTSKASVPSSIVPRQRPKTPEGISKNQAKKWRKNWDFEEKKRTQHLRESQKTSTQLQTPAQSLPSNRLPSLPSVSMSSMKSRRSSGGRRTHHHQNRVLPQYDNPHTKKKSKKQALVQRIPIDLDKQISMFAHLPQNEKYLFYISPKVTSTIHPVILRAGLYYNDGTSWGANTRCITMLNAFKIVVRDLQCPSNKSFARELLAHLNPCIQFLNDCRPQSVSMGNTIRWLKQRISQIAEDAEDDDDGRVALDDDDDEDAEEDDGRVALDDHVRSDSSGGSGLSTDHDNDDVSSDDDDQQRLKSRRISYNNEYNEDRQKRKIMEAISDYVFKIETADKMIQVELLDRIQDGDVILTYCRSYVVEKGLIRAYVEGKQFKVVIVDARPHHEGKRLLHALSRHCPALDISYTLINSVTYVMCKEVTKVLLGAACIMSNGNVVSRAGTATIALVAKHFKIPVLVCCETYKFSERVQIDSICSNELGDFDALIRNGRDKPAKADRTHHASLLGKEAYGQASRLSLDNLDQEQKYKANGEEQNTNGTEDENDSDEQDQNAFKHKLLGNWRNTPKLKMLHLKYDTTPSKLIRMVITELGVMPPSAAPVIIRECHKDRQLS